MWVVFSVFHAVVPSQSTAVLVISALMNLIIIANGSITVSVDAIIGEWCRCVAEFYHYCK